MLYGERVARAAAVAWAVTAIAGWLLFGWSTVSGSSQEWRTPRCTVTVTPAVGGGYRSGWLQTEIPGLRRPLELRVDVYPGDLAEAQIEWEQ